MKISLKFILSIILIVPIVLLQGCNPGEFYTHDLVKAQAKIPFRIIVPTYFPGNVKGISLPSIQGIINKENNNIEVNIRYVLYLNSEAPSDIIIIESNHPFDLGDPKLDPQLVSTEILGRQVVKEEFNHPLGPSSAFSFNSDNIYFVVLLANLSTDEAMKIVESMIEQTD
jgi:low affinity Fe/Cu permease